MSTAPYSPATFDGVDGGSRINAAIAAAAAEASGRAQVIVPPEGPDPGGVWSISRSIEIPSNTTLILDDCTLRLADGADCPIIVNADRDGGNSDIAVIGRGSAHLDGNPTNQHRTRRGRDVEIWMEARGLPLSRATRDDIGELSVAEFEERHALPGLQEEDNFASGMTGPVGMEFFRVERLKIENLDVGPTNMFGIHANGCNDVTIERIRFRQDGSQPNQDGIGIIGPSSRIQITNITGTCGDDAIGLHGAHPVLGGGPISGVTISNVMVRNVWNCGILRTEGPYPITGVVATNLVLLDGEGYSEGHAAVKLGVTRRSLLAAWARPEADPFSVCLQDNIQIHGLTVERWVGPVLAVFQPTANLVISGVTGTHTGPLLANFESKLDGLILSDVATRMIPTPEGEPYVGGMLQYSMAVNGLPQSIRDDERAAIILDGDDVRGVTLENVRVVMDPAASEQARSAGAHVEGLLDRSSNPKGTSPAIRNVEFPGFGDQSRS